MKINAIKTGQQIYNNLSKREQENARIKAHVRHYTNDHILRNRKIMDETPLGQYMDYMTMIKRVVEKTNKRFSKKK